MNKIRIIDLLNKIAKGEEVPKKIMYQGTYYYFDGRDYVLYLDETINYLSDDSLTRYINSFMLNDEVEIIEEEKEIEKFDTNNFHNNDELVYKINELIDEINELKKEGK